MQLAVTQMHKVSGQISVFSPSLSLGKSRQRVMLILDLIQTGLLHEVAEPGSHSSARRMQTVSSPAEQPPMLGWTEQLDTQCQEHADSDPPA